ncbi:LIM/homeobox protein Lhx2-like protein [Dinothrombium tinctorium]|uniref:LIM/homeobox protein Lhx2-like protein n=1 Tax=Dinothrombium tinctorium TaxID=1965070 RepID=A0A3S3Q8E2_9ACAR|nr:LIM/homeobox protein Lhx2-like protein [Dinothrombium tinctorium]RWS17036.1 LIM/homeobox protein Lhx2-like protein [Dinothrombium tinctorium]
MSYSMKASQESGGCSGEHHKKSVHSIDTRSDNINRSIAFPSMDAGKRNSARCGGCGQIITDRYYLLAIDSEWHCDCLRCSYCGIKLESHLTCFSRNGIIYCREDYNRLFLSLKNCARCRLAIKPLEFVMKVRNNLCFHVKCFSCVHCNQQFEKGDYFGLVDDLVYCRYHYQIVTENRFRDHWSTTAATSITPSTTTTSTTQECLIQENKQRQQQQQQRTLGSKPRRYRKRQNQFELSSEENMDIKLSK